MRDFLNTMPPTEIKYLYITQLTGYNCTETGRIAGYVIPVLDYSYRKLNLTVIPI